MPDWVSRYWVEWVFGIVSAVLAAGMKILNKKLKQAQQENNALKDGMRAMLRDRLTQSHDYYMSQGVCPLTARDNILSMYDAYKALGGNGAVTSMMNELKSLPVGTHNSIGGGN